MHSSNYQRASANGEDIPEFLVDSVPFLNSKSDNLVRINKDSIDPYHPAQQLRKLSSSSVNRDERSFELHNRSTSSDTSKFSFEVTQDKPAGAQNQLTSSPLSSSATRGNHGKSISNEENELSSYLNSTQDSFSFHTAHSDGGASQKSLPHSRNQHSSHDDQSFEKSPKLQLQIQTSTPSQPSTNLDYTSNTSQDFSFFNTSGFQADSPAPVKSSTPIESTFAQKNSHSRNSSVSWQVNNPEEWTMERVVLWLDIYQFNESWVRTFRRHKLFGQKFLNLTSYQNLQKFKSELDTSNDSTQSRFIHSLRKTLDRATSVTTINVSSPNPESSVSSYDSSPNDIIDSHPFSASSDPGRLSEKLSSSLSTSMLDVQQSSLVPQTSTPQLRLNRVTSKPRPVSTIEGSSTNMWNSSSPVSPAVPHGLFRRQHQKSNSSESSLFTSLFSSSSSHLPQSQEEKRLSLVKDSPTDAGKSFLSKLRKHRTKSKDKEIVSPTSNEKTSLGSIEHVKLKPQSGLVEDIAFFIDRKYQPISNNKNSDKYIMGTLDNINFKPINIGQCTDRETFSKLLIESLCPSVSDIMIHLTDYGYSAGEALDNDTLDYIIKKKFAPCTGKFLVSPIGTLSTVSSSFASTSDIQSFESKDDKVYPNTPQHYYESTINNKSPPIDYLNFKEHQPEPAKVPTIITNEVKKPKLPPPPPPPHPPPSASLSSPNSASSSSSPTESVLHSQKSTLTRKPPSSLEKGSSFRIIRPTDKGEINFDKRRESPYSNSDSFVAKRSAPPPPLKKFIDIKPLNIRTASVPSLEPVKESLSNEGTFIGPYTPGSSNTLVPEPYKGSGSISPISRKAFDLHLEEQKLNRKRTGISRSYSSRGTEDKFKENAISFDDAPLLDDESDEDGDSDDDFWAKPPSDIKNSSNASTMSEMVVRPAPEVLYENIEKFFPDADLDQPVIDVSTPPSSPSNEKSTKPTQPKLKRVVSSTDKDLEKLNKPQRMKTIRSVAREAGEERKRESIKGNVKSSLLRRQSTKMWGRKVVEVKPNQKQFISKLRRDKNDEIKEFSWIKGELIGKGTFGNVYIALNVTTGEMIAVKQVAIPAQGRENSRVADVIDALRSEVDTLKDLDHFNIVQYLGFERTDRYYNLFLEYVAGGSVASCLKLHGRFEEPLIRFLTSQVLSGMAYLHSRGILHRDLKADNLLLDLDGVCKISDFGISKKSNDIYVNNAAMSMQGTIFWMAPEVVDSSGAGYSAKVDIWSLGCVALEMFAGRRPWSNLEAIPAMLKIGKSKAAPPIPDDTLPFVSMEGREFLDSCFTTDANKRPTAQMLCNHPFSKVPPGFEFSKTRLAALIKANEKRVTV